MVTQCRVCGRYYTYGGACPKGCGTKRRQESTKLYDKNSRDNMYSRFYHTKAWERARTECKCKSNGLDVYAFVIDHEWKEGRIAHHIVEIKEDFDKRLEQDNLIYLSDDTHEQIHQMYKNNKSGMQKLLRDCLEEFKKGEY